MLALMDADMLTEDAPLAKVFAALWTRVGLLTRVDASMLVKDGPLPEAPRTIRT